MKMPFEFKDMPEASGLADAAGEHVRRMVRFIFEYEDSQQALVVYDMQCPLAAALAEAYRRELPNADFIDFDAQSPEAIRESFYRLKPGGLVVLIQTTNFRLDDFRIRVELFKLSLKVIEHPHLGRMRGDESRIYVDSLAYDPDYYRRTGPALKTLMDHAKVCRVKSADAELTFESGFEESKMNIGDYRGMKNWGGQFPIGEVFTEARDLEAVHGMVRIPLFGDVNFAVHRPSRPVLLTVERGRVTRLADSNPEFDRVIESILADEGEVWVRELGFGMNRAFSLERRVTDIGTFERMCGVHLSLGSKHALYKKPHFKTKAAKHHVDVFAAVDSVRIDDREVYRDGSWIIP